MDEEVIIQPIKWVSKEEVKKIFPSNEYFEEMDEGKHWSQTEEGKEHLLKLLNEKFYFHKDHIVKS